tara:strand:+ start:274 stop:678 length:405 start_codon:yes stop_codon:yes gene_type:complete
MSDKDPQDYLDFVNSVTSDASKNQIDFVDALMIMEEQGAEPSRLMTAALGLNGEAAEFSEIIKKCIFQGKEFDDDTHKRLKSELSDVMWYVAQGCIALNTSIDELCEINTNKLKERYPEGFSKDKSENRKEGDL